MRDTTTTKDLASAGTRVAPAANPATGGHTDRYPFEQTRRSTMRALSLPLAPGFTVGQLREGQTRLAQLATVQQLEVREVALFALLADPLRDAPDTWRWELLLPVSGSARPDADQHIGCTRLHGGAYLETLTLGGMADLPRLYEFFLGGLLPARRQQLTRPIIYHRVLAGIDRDDADALTLEVFIPFGLSLRPPLPAPPRAGF